MRDYRDAKAMAHTLREALAEKNCKISVAESLELVAHIFGMSDWNTLSASIKNAHPASAGPPPAPLRFSPALEQTLRGSLDSAFQRSHPFASIEHLLLSLTEDPDAANVMRACGVDPASVRELLMQRPEISQLGDRMDMVSPEPAPGFQKVVQRAIIHVGNSGRGEMTGADLLVGLLLEEDSAGVRILRELGMNRDKAVQVLARNGR